MTLPEIIDYIKRNPSGGIATDESRFDDVYLESILNVYRAQVLKLVYQKDNRINPVCYQRHYPEFEKKLQDGALCKVLFRSPEVISFDSRSDGFRYVGSIDCANAFRRHQSRATLSTVIKNKFLNIESGRFTSYLYNGSDQLIEVYGNPMIQELLIEAVFADPSEIPIYNKQIDQYPVNEDLLPMIFEQVFKAVTGPQAATPTDLISEGNDATPQQLMRRQ